MQLKIYNVYHLKICYHIIYLLGYLKILFTLQWSFEKQHSYATLVELKFLFIVRTTAFRWTVCALLYVLYLKSVHLHYTLYRFNYGTYLHGYESSGKADFFFRFMYRHLPTWAYFFIYNNVATPLKAFMLQVKQDHRRINHVHLQFNLGEMSF
jgi:hypothetical protein